MSNACFKCNRQPHWPVYVIHRGLPAVICAHCFENIMNLRSDRTPYDTLSRFAHSVQHIADRTLFEIDDCFDTRLNGLIIVKYYDDYGNAKLKWEI